MADAAENEVDDGKTPCARLDRREGRPGCGELVAIALVAILLRIVVAEAAIYRGKMSADDFSFLRDGDSYIRVGISMTGDDSVVKPFDRRVFPGYPALIALVHSLGAPAALAALILNWLCAGVAASLAAVLFNDRRVGWAMAILTPSYLMYSTLAMSEPTMLAFITGGLVLAVAGRPLAGGLLLGCAGLIRPVACFAALGYIIHAAVCGKYRKAVIFSVVSLAVVFTGMAALLLWRGDALESIRLYAADQRAYGGEPLTWPFKSLICTPIAHKTTVWKTLYIYAHVALALVACVLAVPSLRKKTAPERESARDAAAPHFLAAPWLWANTLFVLCVGANWGFHEFHRFIVPALPPLFAVYGRWLPVRRVYWVPIAFFSVILAVWGVSH